jgi:hypothetical protein
MKKLIILSFVLLVSNVLSAKSLGIYNGIIDFTISEIEVDSCSVSIEQTAAGTLVAIASGESPYSYLWDTGETNSLITPIQDGIYCVTITDSTNCSASACYNLLTDNPDSCWVNITSFSSGDSLLANGNGVAPFFYLWSSGEIGPVISPVVSSEYCVTMTDASGCVAVDCFWNDEGDIGQDSCLVNIIELDSGEISAESSGAAPFSYLWSSGEMMQSILPNDLDTLYCVTITDAVGCVSNSCIDFWSNPIDTSMCFVAIDSLSGDSLKANGYGTAPFLYEWNTGDTSNFIIPTETGEYCVTIIDADGCTSSTCIWFNNQDPCWVDVYESAPGVLIADPFGVSPFIYSWNTGGSTSQIFADGLEPAYCVTVTDAQGCVATNCMIYDGGISQDSCGIFIEQVGEGNMSIDIKAFTNGVAPFSYLWDTDETTEIITVYTSGFYEVTVTDAQGQVCSNGYNYNSPFNDDIRGNLFLADSIGQGLLSGWVYLYEMTGIGTNLVDSTQISGSPSGWANYRFYNVLQGDYIVKAELDFSSNGYDDHVPTYHLSEIWWNEANIISIPNTDSGENNHIIFVETDGFGGGEGEIGGMVQSIDGWSITNDPMSNVSVIIMDEFENLLGHLKTDQQGRFKFEDLAWGTYKIGIEITGLPQVFYLVTLSPETPVFNNIRFEVYDDEITVTSLNTILKESSFEISPNPVSEILTIHLDLYESNSLQVELLHPSGQILKQESINLGIGQQKIEWNLEHLPSGIYFINLKKNHDVLSKKLIKK